MNRVETRLLPGTERGSQPFFSPDGRWVGFWAEGKLQKVSVDGGSPRLIAEAPQAAGASWGEDGTIVYTPTASAGLYRTSAEGGIPQRLTEPDGKVEASHRWPQILPSGRAVLFTIHPPSGRPEDCRIAILSLETGEERVIVEGGTYGRYLPTGHLLYGSRGTVFAAPFDVRRLELTGPAIPALENVRMDSRQGFGGVQIAFSRTGILAYVIPRVRPRETQLLWIDRKGGAAPVSLTRRSFEDPNLSSDGRYLAVVIEEPNNDTNLWVYDRLRETWAQLTFEKNNSLPQWSPSGDRLAFASNREGYQNLFVMPIDGGVPKRLTTSRNPQLATGWSPDGEVVLFAEQDPASFWDLWKVPVAGTALPEPVLVAQGFQGGGRLSPDGRWLAYRSSESGRPEIYVRSYRGPGQKWTISTDGGRQPRWSRTGREIFYLSEQTGSYKIVAVPVTIAPTFRPGVPRVLFERHKDSYSNFDVAPDGEHFVVAELTESEPERLQIVVIPDWFEELKAKVPVTR